VLAAHNGFTFDFKMLAACLLRARMQQQQQPASNAAPCSCNTENNSSCSSKEREQNNSCRSSSSSSSSAALNSTSCCELPAGLLTLDSLVLARRLNLKQQAGLDNLQQGVLGHALTLDGGSML
jgi:hypothetical protein